MTCGGKKKCFPWHPQAPQVVYYLTTKINLLLSPLTVQKRFQNLMQLYVGLSEKK